MVRYELKTAFNTDSAPPLAGPKVEGLEWTISVLPSRPKRSAADAMLSSVTYIANRYIG
ncbi:MAG: hypothetical protein OXG25_07475 [Gammaproteobacteria bacterium]|nr:hypothetical protein [Gammaproteobacteria bacterium]